MDIEVGLRVVRGPDWEWGDLDGGEGHVGTVVEVEESMDGGHPVIVQWDSGSRCRCRCGVEGKFDLRVLDSAPTGHKHPYKSCRYCLTKEVTGMMWQCVHCFEYFLCSPCYLSGKHSLNHAFLRIDSSDQSSRVKVCARSQSDVIIKARGIFATALVVRGADWKWEDQDGGLQSVGRVHSFAETKRDVVLVLWEATGETNQYRIGCKGKVDLKLSPNQPDGSSIWSYNPGHLPILGDPSPLSTGDTYAAGDLVKVELNPDVWKDLQDGHGGWNDLMSMFIGSVGVILRIDDDSDLLINYQSNAMFHVNAAAVTKVDSPGFKIGDVVRVLDDSGEVAKQQKDHGEWIDVMESSIGQLGRVIKVLPSGDIRLLVAGSRWIFNPASLRPSLPGEKLPTEDDNESHVNPSVRAQLSALMEKKNSALVPYAAAAGDGATLREFLKTSPADVDTKQEGKTALHIAAAEGFTNIIKILIEFKANVDQPDDAGNTPLHVCANLNQADSAQLLMEARANVVYQNNIGMFPLALATNLGHYDVMKVLSKVSKQKLSSKDTEGNTALHIAVLFHRIEAVDILLNAGADPTLYNLNYFTPLLEASKNGFYAGIERLLKYNPKLVTDVKGDDGHTALHIAAANDHLDVVCLLALQLSCDLNAVNLINKLTPLHLAAQRGYGRIIEHLIGYGADVCMEDTSSHTALHMVLSQSDLFVMGKKTNTHSPKDTPQITTIKDELTALNGGKEVEHFVAITCFLVCEGAVLDRVDKYGISPIALCPPEMVPLIRQVAEKRGDKRFGGSLPRYHPTSAVQRLN